MDAAPATSLLHDAPDVTPVPGRPPTRPSARTVSAAAASPAARLALAGVFGGAIGAIGTLLLPQGPSTPGTVFASVTAGLLVGAVAGRMTSTRWAAAIASGSCLVAVGSDRPLLLALVVPIALGALLVRAYDRHADDTDVLAAAIAAVLLGVVTAVLLLPVLPTPSLAVDDDGLPLLLETDR